MGEVAKTKNFGISRTERIAALRAQGNNFWTVRLRTGKRAFETAEDLMEAADDYFTWATENPWITVQPFKVGDEIKMVDVPKARAFNFTGLCVYLGIHTETYRGYRLMPELKDACAVIDDIIYTQKYEGAAVGIFNATLIARDLGLSERLEHTGRDGAPMQIEDTSADAAAFLRNIGQLRDASMPDADKK